LPDVSRIDSLDIGLVFPNGTARYVTDDSTASLGDRDYVQKAFSGESTVSDIIISRVSGEQVLMFASPVRATEDPSSPAAGVLIARKDAAALSDLVAAIKPSHDSGYAYLVNRSGTIVAHPDSQMVADAYNPINLAQNDASLKSFADMTSLALTQLSGTAFYEMDGIRKVCAYAEVPGYPWLLFVTVDENDFESGIVHMRSIMIIIGIICALAGIVIAIFIGRSIARPVAQAAGTLKIISEGDLTRIIDIKSNDEIGDLANYFNQTIEKIKYLITIIKQKTESLLAIGGDLSSNMTETAAAINQITTSIQSVKTKAINQSASVTQTNATMGQITINIDKLNDHVEQQTMSVAQSSSAIEEMLANIQSVTRTLVQNAENVNELTGASEVGRSGLEDVAKDIQEIAHESEGLLEINAVMENISSQTNLLSMNAAIEAAHAGEAGKGFAVVASEIRKLAESSAEQSNTISAVLKKISASINKITQSTNNVLKKFEAIDSRVRIVAEQEENIRNAMEEQGHGSKEILEAISRLNEVTQQVKGGSAEMLEGSTEVINESKNLEIATQEISVGLNEMASGADQINVAVNSVNDLSAKNRENIELLMKEVSRFKV
jgi:methyl-accepting chemotaxis protein